MHDAHARSTLAGKTHEASLRESKQGLPLWSITFNRRRGSRKPSAVWRCTGLVLSLGAPVTSVGLSAESASAESTAQPSELVRRETRTRSVGSQMISRARENFGPRCAATQTATPFHTEETPRRSRKKSRCLPTALVRGNSTGCLLQRAPHHRPELRHGHEEDRFPNASSSSAS